MALGFQLVDATVRIQTRTCVHTHAHSPVAVRYSSWPLAKWSRDEALIKDGYSRKHTCFGSCAPGMCVGLEVRASVILFFPVKVPDVQNPKRCTVKVSEDGAGLGEDGVKFPLLEPVQSGKTKP